MSKKKVLVSYNSDEEEENPPLKRPKSTTIIKRLQTSNQLTQTYEDFTEICQNCIKNSEELNERSKASEKLVNSLREELFVCGKRISTMQNDEYSLQKKISTLEQVNQNLSKEAQFERKKYLAVSARFQKLEKDHGKVKEDFSLKEKRLKESKAEEIEEYKKMAEKFIAKADEENEAESQRADNAELKIEALKNEITSLQNSKDLLNIANINLQTAYDELFSQSISVPKVDETVVKNSKFDDEKNRRRIQRQAKEMFSTWRNNYVKNKNSQIEFENEQLKKKLKECEGEKQKEIRNVLNSSHEINNLKSERINLMSTIKELKNKINELEKQQAFGSKKNVNSAAAKDQKESKASDKSDKRWINEFNNLKENITELIERQNVMMSSQSTSFVRAASQPAQNVDGPKWKIPKKFCDDLFKRCNNHIKFFLEEYIPQLFAFADKLLPEKVLEKTAKWVEIKAVIDHYFQPGDEDEADSNLETFKEIMSGKRYQSRSKMYRLCSQDRLCAVTSTDKFFYYFPDKDDNDFFIPFSDQSCEEKLEYKIYETSFTQYSIPQEYESCAFIIVVKDNAEIQQIIRIDCATGIPKILAERKKNI